MLAGYRAPYRGRSTPVNAWWGSFDLAVSLFSGEPADPPSEDFIMRNAMDSQEVAVGWWPGDARYAQGGLLRLRAPRAGGVRGRDADPAAARWDEELGVYILDWDDARGARGSSRHRARVRPLGLPARLPVCGWDPALAASAEGSPPPVV